MDRDTIKLLLEAAMAAPSACNLQPWEFVILDTPERIDEIKPHIGGGQFYTPVILAVCANTSYVPWPGDGWKLDCSAAVGNLMIMATALGLGTLWIGDFQMEPLREALKLPGHVELMSIIYIGYPTQPGRPRTQYEQEAVYYQAYDPGRVHEPRTIQGQLAKNRP